MLPDIGELTQKPTPRRDGVGLEELLGRVGLHLRADHAAQVGLDADFVDCDDVGVVVGRTAQKQASLETLRFEALPVEADADSYVAQLERRLARLRLPELRLSHLERRPQLASGGVDLRAANLAHRAPRRGNPHRRPIDNPHPYRRLLRDGIFIFSCFHFGLYLINSPQLSATCSNNWRQRASEIRIFLPASRKSAIVGVPVPLTEVACWPLYPSVHSVRS